MAQNLISQYFGSGSGSSGGSVSGLLSDPNFLSLLAGLGAGLDPEGPGGAIGRPTQQSIQSQAAQGALEKQEQKRNEQIQMIIKALGGVTPQGQAGVTGVKRSKTGALTLDMDLPSDIGEEGEPVGDTGAFQAPSSSGQRAASGAPTNSTEPRQRQQLSNIVPF